MTRNDSPLGPYWEKALGIPEQLQKSGVCRKIREHQAFRALLLLVICNYQELECNWSGFQQRAVSRPYSCSVTRAPRPCRRSPPLGGAARPGHNEAAPPRGSPQTACREGVAEARLLAAGGHPSNPPPPPNTPDSTPKPLSPLRALPGPASWHGWSLGCIVGPLPSSGCRALSQPPPPSRSPVFTSVPLGPQGLPSERNLS